MRSLNESKRLELVYVNEPGLDLHFLQRTGSVLRLYVVDLLSSGSTDNRICVDHEGEGCRTEIFHLSYLKGDARVSTQTCVRHNVGGGTSRQLVKFVLDGEARGEFFGELHIAQDAQHTEAEQTNRNLLLSPKALVRTRPQLEIYADDVKASHGATTGQLDEAALFYMRQRGIGPETARKMLIVAFLQDVLSDMADDRRREELMQAVDSIVE